MEISAEEKVKLNEQITALKANRANQQMLPAWRPIPSLMSSMVCFNVFGVIFLAIGIAMAAMSNNIKEVSVSYSDKCDLPSDKTFGSYSKCTVDLELPEDIEGPIYVYYELENFY